MEPRTTLKGRTGTSSGRKILKRRSQLLRITKDIDRYCHIADLEELQENDFNLNVPRYVDISEPEEEIDIQAAINELKKSEKEREEVELKVKQDLKELQFKV